MRFSLHSNQRGFTLVDMLAVVVILVTASAIALPSMISAMDRAKLPQAAREVERELQTAKSRAVIKGRAMRVRFNCPSAGEYRMVELLGTTSVPLAADSAVDRCSPTLYPYPAGDSDPVTTPNLDGPVRTIDSTIVFGNTEVIEFRANGTAWYEAGPGDFDLIPVAGIQITLVRDSLTETITVNGLGKVSLQ
jgi:prepilin-type N-terminal cleavage/methylation domain-containing protein